MTATSTPRSFRAPIAPEERLRRWHVDRSVELLVIQAPFVVEGPVDWAVLEAAFGHTARSHDALVSRFAIGSERVEHVVEPDAPLPLREVTHDARRPWTLDEARAWLSADAAQGFDPLAAPLVRAARLPLDGDRHLLVFSLSHLAADGWSLRVFLEDVARTYNALIEGDELPELASDYDLGAWARDQRREICGARLQTHADFWRRILGDDPARHGMRLPGDTGELLDPARVGESSRLEATLDGEIAAAVRTMARHHRTTVFALLLSVYSRTLREASGVTDLTLASSYANRQARGTDRLVGCLTSRFFVRVDLGQAATADEYVRVAHDALVSSLAHAVVPFGLVQELVWGNGARVDETRLPYLATDDFSAAELTLGSAHTTVVVRDDTPSNEGPSCWVGVTPETVRVRVRYPSLRMTTDDAVQFLSAFVDRITEVARSTS